jgi:hypothetical protein
MFIAAPEHMRYELLSSTFSSVFTPEEETILAGEIAQGAWNGKTVRLERLLNCNARELGWHAGASLEQRQV